MLRRLDKQMGGHLLGTLLGWEVLPSVCIGGAVGWFGDEGGLRAVSTAVGTAQSQVGVAVLGVVLAALAILIVFLSDEYVELLQKAGLGVMADIAPFKYTMTVAALTAASGVALIAIGNTVDTWLLRLLFGLSTFTFTYLLFVACQLVEFLSEHMRLRVMQIEARRAADEALRQQRKKASG